MASSSPQPPGWLVGVLGAEAFIAGWVMATWPVAIFAMLVAVFVVPAAPALGWIAALAFSAFWAWLGYLFGDWEGAIALGALGVLLNIGSVAALVPPKAA